MNYTKKNLHTDSSGRYVLRLQPNEIDKYLAAPNMYEALKRILELCPSTCKSLEDAQNCPRCLAIDAIAKAEEKIKQEKER